MSLLTFYFRKRRDNLPSPGFTIKSRELESEVAEVEIQWYKRIYEGIDPLIKKDDEKMRKFLAVRRKNQEREALDLQ